MAAKQSFEEALKQLEGVVSNLEKGELSLEEALKVFQKGIVLTEYCNNKLDEAEKKITLLLEKKDGSMEEKDFLTEA